MKRSDLAAGMSLTAIHHIHRFEAGFLESGRVPNWDFKAGEYNRFDSDPALIDELWTGRCDSRSGVHSRLDHAEYYTSRVAASDSLFILRRALQLQNRKLTEPAALLAGMSLTAYNTFRA